MSTDTTDPDDGYNSLELRRMDEQAARNTLTVAEYERWEQLHEMVDRAEQTRERWADEDEQVADIEVAAEMDQLGTEVDIYGNDLLVHLDTEDPELTAVAEDLDAYREDVGDISDADELEAMDDADAEELAGLLLDFLDCMIVRWNGTEWADLSDHQRQTILADARRKWNLDGVVLAWIDMIAAIEADREERLEVMESFRGETRGRGR